MTEPDDDRPGEPVETAELTVEVLTQRLTVIRQRIEAAGGDLQRTSVLAVTKTFPVEVCRLAVDTGLVDLGENYSQELEAKAPALDRDAGRWHFIGGLQRNKIKRLASVVSVWQTMDRVALLDELATRAPAAVVMVQVNTTDEPQKSGCAPDEAPALVEHARELGLEVRGLMTIGPTDGSHPGPAFARLHALAERLDVAERSMGMTGDLEIAVAEGSTMVRVGTALFGSRSLGVPSGTQRGRAG